MTRLRKKRQTTIRICPEVSETIAYGLPTLKYKGKNLLHFGAFKEHMSIFPDPHATEILREKLSSYKVSRGTIKYTDQRLIPEALIIELLTVGLADIDAAA